jgi:hypothetical protein
MVAWHLLWACLGEYPWKEEGHPFHSFKYNVPFWGPPGLYLPREKKACYQPSPLNEVQSLYGGFQSIYS